MYNTHTVALDKKIEIIVTYCKAVIIAIQVKFIHVVHHDLFVRNRIIFCVLVKKKEDSITINIKHIFSKPPRTSRL